MVDLLDMAAKDTPTNCVIAMKEVIDFTKRAVSTQQSKEDSDRKQKVLQAYLDASDGLKKRNKKAYKALGTTIQNF